MPKARNKPSKPTMPVEFIETQAQNKGCEVVTIDDGEGRCFRRRRYRWHQLDHMFKAGRITERQKSAGMALHDAYCKTQLSPPAVPEIQVDKTPRPDEATVNQCDAMMALGKMTKAVQAEHMPVIRHVCFEDRPIRRGLARNGLEESMERARLQVSLDIIANGLGY